MNSVFIEVHRKSGDHRQELLQDTQELGIKDIGRIQTFPIYVLSGPLSLHDASKIAYQLLSDPIIESYAIKDAYPSNCPSQNLHIIDRAFRFGVMDPRQESIQKAIFDLVHKEIKADIITRFIISGGLSAEQLQAVKDKILLNKLIHREINDSREYPAPPSLPIQSPTQTVNLLEATDDELLALSRDRLWLDLEEMRAIQKIFRDLKRNPTVAELEQFGVSWSEHTSHKTFKTPITHDGQTISLMEMIHQVTRSLNKTWCLSTFADNAGVIAFDKHWGICMKVETHNHPSALEPYGGAGTGIGGVIRDILGTGLVAKPIANTDVFCFGPMDMPYDKLPQGVLHPKRIARAVAAGVRDYGNRMGIPTVNGAVCFHNQYVANPLVFCGCAGIMPINKAPKGAPKKDDFIVVMGGKTGKDGIHGATFSSGELTAQSETISSGCVQMPNAITEKKLQDALLLASASNLFHAITDCGAGGLACAISEQGENLGATVHLHKVPLKYHGLLPHEIWISESQERMVLAVPQANFTKLKEICDTTGTEMAILGYYNGEQKLKVLFQGETIIDLDLQLLKNPPAKIRKIALPARGISEPQLPEPPDLTDDLLQVLNMPNIRSKEEIFRQYDHEVQGATIGRPWCGKLKDGPSDAAILKPQMTAGYKALILANGINPLYGLINPYWMAASAVDEALRQITAVGGSIDYCALLDNICFGKTDTEEALWDLFSCVKGFCDAALKFGTPLISGKDSLNNVYKTQTGEIINIPPTVLISALAIMEDCREALNADFKQPGNLIYLAGKTHNELGGSAYYHNKGHLGENVPKVDFKQAAAAFRALRRACRKGLIVSCHDLSEGGLGTALAEMCLASEIGALLNFSAELTPAQMLFSESNSRFLIEAEPAKAKKLEKNMRGIPLYCLGKTQEQPNLEIAMNGRQIIKADLKTIRAVWKQKLLS
ncbi:MAG: phosphoribosylformylglycinamidine synthase subunit PurL [Candidatus Omnitrophica bacterium]|nr:phosphoribosylformylglycinamidine synthase subunit PurL [Candidatus Omnitrophota bacterium]